MRAHPAVVILCLLGVCSTAWSAEPGAGGIFTREKIVEVMRKVREYQLAHPWKETDRNWIRATYYTGVMGLYRATRDPEILAQARRWAEKHQWAEGNERERANKKTCGQTYLELHFIEPESANIAKIRAYVDSRIGEIEAGESPTKGWYYCDTLYVGPPTIAMLGKATGEQKYYDYLNKMYWDVTDHLFDEEYGLFYRDKKYFDAKTENGRKVFWSRGNGWVIGGIPRILRYLPKENERYDDYVRLLQTMAAAIARRQGDDGLWRSNLDDPDQHPNPETSGTAFFCYAMAWGINNGVLDRDEFLPVVIKAWEGLVCHVHPDGKLGFVQPVGAAPKPATSEMTHEYAMGLFLLAGEEMIKLISASGFTPDVRSESAVDGDSTTLQAGGAAKAAPAVRRFARNGGWCWFQDPRAIIHNGKLIVGSVSGSGSQAGDVRCSVCDLKAGSDLGTFVLHPKLQSDDHNAPAFYARPDGRILAVYAYHTSPAHYYRISEPDDPTRWGPEQAFKHPHSISYMNLYYHPPDDTLYNFYRDTMGTYCPAYLTSRDHGQTWEIGGQLIAHGLSGRHRPYPRYSADSQWIYVCFTEAHPQEYPAGCGIYFAKFRGGKFYKADGTIIKDLARGGPLRPGEAEQVLAGEPDRSAWTSSISTDAAGRIFIAYSVRRSPSDHRFRYACWDGKRWHNYPVAYAGAGLYPHAYDYTGLITIDPTLPGRVYFATNVDPTHGTCNTSGKHEMVEATTADLGRTWKFMPLTRNSPVTNMRPVCVVGQEHVAVLWMRGRYSTYVDFDTDIVGFIRRR